MDEFNTQSAPVEEGGSPVSTQPAPMTEQELQVKQLTARMHSSAGWFHWISVLTFVNSILAFASDKPRQFLIGLFLPSVGAQLSHIVKKGAHGAAGSAVMIIALVLTLIFAAVFFALGTFAKKGHAWAFIVGMVLYLLDAGLFAIFGDFFSFGLHLFALFCIWQGLKALRILKQNELAA